MKTSLRALTAGLVAATALTVSAAAADFDHCADALNQMGLFQGSASGYELDRAPTRAESAVMLVRLLGKEADAKALTYTAPFTDLEDWQKPYVQYLYSEGLTTGATATTFEPEGICDAQMYSTFLLRALGYSDAAGGDFTYAGSVDKATELGVADIVNCDKENFLRDNVVAMSYTALSVQPKDQSADSLLAKLVADGAIEEAKAKTTLDQLAAFKEYSAVAAKQAEITNMSMDAKIDATAKLNGANMMSMVMDMNIKAIMDMQDLNKSVMSMAGKVNLEMDESLVENPADAKLEQDISYYYTDGNYYMSVEDQKIKMPMDFSDAQAMMDSMQGMVATTPISAIKSLTKSGDTFTVEYTPEALTSMVDTVLKGMNMESLMTGVTLEIGSVKETTTVSQDQLSAMDMSMSMSAEVEGQKLDMDMTISAKITGTGDDVKIELPTDLSTYTAMSDLLNDTGVTE